MPVKLNTADCASREIIRILVHTWHHMPVNLNIADCKTIRYSSLQKFCEK